MERPTGMAVEPGAHLLVLVGGVVVEDDVDDFSGRDVTLEGIEETDELLMPVALHVLPEHLAGQDIERREQRGRPVALVVVGHGGAAPLLQRQPRLRAIEGLDLGLLVEAEDHGMSRRAAIEPDDIVQFFDEGGIVGELEQAPPMRSQTMGSPYLLNRRDGQARDFGHGASRPVRRLKGWRLQCHGDYGRGLVIRNGCLAGRARLVTQEPVHAFFHEARLPALDGRLRRASLGHDRARADTVGAQQHDPGAPDVFLWGVAICDQSVEPPPVSLAESDRYSIAHVPDSHMLPPSGIPLRTLPSRSIHEDANVHFRILARGPFVKEIAEEPAIFGNRRGRFMSMVEVRQQTVEMLDF